MGLSFIKLVCYFPTKFCVLRETDCQNVFDTSAIYSPSGRHIVLIGQNSLHPTKYGIHCFRGTSVYVSFYLVNKASWLSSSLYFAGHDSFNVSHCDREAATYVVTPLTFVFLRGKT